MKLPVLSGREVIKALKKIGFEEKRQKGSHIILAKETEMERKALLFPITGKLTKELCWRS